MAQELTIRINADGSAAIAGVKAVTDGLQRLQTNVSGVDRSAESATSSLVRMGQAAAAALSVKEVAAAADSWASMNAQLKIATGSIQAGAEAYSQVVRIAMATGQAVGEVSNVYKRFADNATTLGISQKEVAAATTTVSQAIALSGGSAASAQAALMQFGQALASGTLRGEELNSVLEQAPRLAKTIADGMGVPVGKLKELAEQGKITSEEIVKALSGQAGKLSDEFGQLPITIGRAMTNLNTAFTDAVGSFEKSSGAFNTLAQGLDGVARHMDIVATAAGSMGAVMAGKTVAGLAASAQATLAQIEAQKAAQISTAAAVQAEFRRAEANQMSAASELSRAQAVVSSTQLEIATVRERLASTALLVRAEIELEKQRYASQISDIGRTLRMQEMANLSQQLAAVQAAEAASGTRLVAVLEAQTVAAGNAAQAKASLNLASSASVAANAAAANGAGLAARAMGALGGPIGIVTTALTLGATAWMIWGNKTEQATTEAARSAAQNLDSIINKITEMNGRLADVTRKSYEATVKASDSELKTVRANVVFLQTELEKLDSAGGKGRFSQAGKDLQNQLNTADARSIVLQNELATAREKSAEVGTASLNKFVNANAVGAEKVRVKQTQLLQEYAQAIAQTGGVTDLANKDHKRAYDALNAGLADAAKATKSTQSGLKNDLSQIAKAGLDEVRSNSKLEIDLVKDRVAQRTLAEEEGVAQIKAIQIKAAQDEIAILAQRYGASKDPGEKALLLKDMVVASNAATRAIGAAETALVKLDDTAFKSHQAYMKGIGDETASLLEKAKASEEENARIGLTAEQLAVLTTKRYDEAIAIKEAQAFLAFGVVGRENEVFYIDEQIAALKRLKNAEIAKPKLTEQAQEWKRFTDDIERSLTDSLYRSFEAGSGFGETFVNSLKNTLKAAALKLVIQYAVTGTGNLVGSIGNAAVNAVMGTSGSNGGSGTNWLGTASNVQSAYSLYNNAGIAAQWLGGSMSTANAAGTVYANAAGTGLDGLLATNGAYGTAAAGAEAGAAGGSAGASSSMGAAGTVAWVAAIIVGMKMSSDAWKAGVRWEKYADGPDDQLRGTKKYDPEVPLRAAIDRPMEAIFGKDFVNSEFYAVMSGSSLSLQIRKWAFEKAITTGTPQLSGNFSEQGFTGGKTEQEITSHGGWFTKTKRWTETTAITAELDTQLDYMYYSISETLLDVGDIFGDSSLLEKIKSFSMSVNVAAGDSTFAVVADQLTAALGNHLLPSITAIKNEGEKWQDTLARALIQANAVNRVFVLTGKTLASAFGRDNSDRILYMSDRLVDLFGTIDEMSASVSTYYAAFYTPAEQVKQAWADLTAQLSGMNQQMPDSVVGYRALVDSMDLTTESGQSLFAALVKLSPAFAAAVEGTDKLAQETAASLLSAYNSHADLIPALSQISVSAMNAAAATTALGAATGTISTIFLDANSPLLTFGLGVANLSPALTNAQMTSAALSAEIDTLRLGASAAQIDIAGLSDALASVNTATFVATVSGVFDLLASRITGVIGSISTERAAVREAALSIINPTVMSRDAILRSVAAINTVLPNQSGIVAANASLSAADQRKAAADQQVANYAGAANYYSGQYGAQQSNINGLQAAITSINNGMGPWLTELAGQRNAYAQYSQMIGPWNVWPGEDGGPTTDYNPLYTQRRDEAAGHVTEIENQINAWNQQIASYSQGINASYAAMSVISGQYQAAINSMSAWQGESAAAAAQQASAQATVKASILAYTAAIQQFTVDASKSVSKLSRLREETVKYYEAQKALAELMTNSAAGLRATVADYRYAQLTDAQQYEKLQSDYATAYSLALSTSGESLSGYGDRLNAILPALLEKASAVLSSDAYSAAAATAIARAEAIAAKLETTAPTNYAADSLDMLTNIDATLAALDASASSAEKIISDAVKAGADRTAAGLHAVIAALTGQAIPGFAAGGDHVGGFRIVGENGPEIESTGPSRIFNASQTRQILSGGSGNTARLEALVERQARQLESMSYELRAIASSNARLARLAEIQDRYGLQVHTESGTPLQVEAL